MKSITKEEGTALYHQKISEGKSPLQASAEVKKDKLFIKEFIIEKRDMEKEMKKMKKEKEKMDKQFKKEFDKMAKAKDNVSLAKAGKIKTSKSGQANTRHLNRILYYLEDFPESNKTNIARGCMIDTATTNNGLVFLVKIKKVKETTGKGGVNTYSLN